MKYYELDKEEQAILDAYDAGKLSSVRGKEAEIKRLRSYTHSSLERARNINIRLSERDLLRIKAKAAELGLPYQTFVSSLLHQHA